MTETTTYEVKNERGETTSQHRSESAAIRKAKATGGSVTMHVVSGTYESRTTVYPYQGQTFSN